jgi:hypothetical protein
MTPIDCEDSQLDDDHSAAWLLTVCCGPGLRGLPAEARSAFQKTPRRGPFWPTMEVAVIPSYGK